MNRIEQAQSFAHAGHDLIRQVRKYTGEPYWVHTDEVARIVSLYGATSFDTIISAHLHDLVEDVNRFPFNLEGIQGFFGASVATLVDELTNKFTPQRCPNQPRSFRKREEFRRIATISQTAKFIKLADIFSNIDDIVDNDIVFARTYLMEKQRIMPYLQGSTNQSLWDVVNSRLQNLFVELK